MIQRLTDLALTCWGMIGKYWTSVFDIKAWFSGRVKKFSMYTKHTAVITYNSFGYEPECFRQFLSGWCEGMYSAMHRHTLLWRHAQCNTQTHFECCEGTCSVMHNTLWMLWRNSQCNAQTCSEWCEDTLSAMHRHFGFKRKTVVRSYNQHGPETLWNYYLWDVEFYFPWPTV